jgi:hypothetical protein
VRFSQKAVLWLRRLVAGLSRRGPVFEHGSIHVGFVVDKVALGQIFLSTGMWCNGGLTEINRRFRGAYCLRHYLDN